jgi:hypothetical protein
MRNRILIEIIDKLYFIFINYRLIYIVIKEIDREAKLLEKLIADLLLNLENNLVEIKAI